MVRDTLGEDAIIVATREENGGRAVRVTAAVEPAFEISRSGGPAGAEDWLQYDAEDEEFAISEELTEVMLRHSVPEEVMDHVLSCATVVGLETPSIALIAAIEHLFNFKPLPLNKSAKKPMIFTGPPGAGKTLAVAKVAARSVMNGMKVGVISCDTIRAGGFEQLNAFTKLLRIDLKKAGTPRELTGLLGEMRDFDHVLIDTAGLNPFDTEDVKNTAKLLGAADMESYFVLPAGIDADEAGEMARIFSTIGVHSMIPTRIDMARRLGGVLSAAHYGGMSFADASNTPKVADGLVSLDPKTLAGMLMPGSYNEAGRKKHQKTGTRQ